MANSVDTVFEGLGSMTVLELVELKKKIEDEWGITAAAPVAVAAPAGVLETVAGLALIGTFAASAAAALADPDHREAAALTFVVAASGFVVGGVGAAFWSLVAGGLLLVVTRRPA